MYTVKVLNSVKLQAGKVNFACVVPWKIDPIDWNYHFWHHCFLQGDTLDQISTCSTWMVLADAERVNGKQRFIH